ncbi:hypothetical protein [Enterococcus pallens]|uniref:Uncharacterized protein n=1 Tax=Enterococcus pallens ATCC BAA-351 TaxID=1158607 RepID=R2SPT7_9ENTE|nr:hypothetical protein [Enterococcus pallens]EOH94821.1 hypothetical protein UAU_01743 [Enterococcus pallens ATCC BAA-351]EOU14860.1 hypothetical protein I588_04510 [Enterococcus pallens ATCC BAA-351]
MENDLKQGDIVSVIVESDFCGLPAGVFQGIVVDLKEYGKSIAFTDTSLALRAKGLGVAQFLDEATWGNFDIVRLVRGEAHEI